MGTWGTGLYQNDEAEDLKPLIGQLLKLPFSEDDIVARIVDWADGEDSVDAFLILADQFEKRGIHHEATFQKALHIIESGADIARLRGLEMDERDLAARQKVLKTLAARLNAPRPAKPRKTLKKAKPLPVASGDVIAFPIDAKGQGINPYFSPALLARSGFEQAGWSVIQVVDTGFEYDLLPWVSVVVTEATFPTQPTMGDLTGATRFSRAAGFGTLSPNHFKKMGMVKIGTAPRPTNLLPAQAGAHNAQSVVMSDVSISNALILKQHLLAQ